MHISIYFCVQYCTNNLLYILVYMYMYMYCTCTYNTIRTVIIIIEDEKSPGKNTTLYVLYVQFFE